MILRQTRDTVNAAAGKVMSAAADTRAAVIGIGIVAAAALCIALGALVLAVRAVRAVRA